MAKRTNIHVVPRENGWGAIREGNQRATSVHSTQREAQEAARQVAQRENGEVFIHRPNGQIRDRDSYGNDPFPPKG